MSARTRFEDASDWSVAGAVHCGLAPGRPQLFLTYNALVLAFGTAVWASADRIRGRRVAGVLLAAVGVVGMVATPFSASMPTPSVVPIATFSASRDGA